MTTGTVAAGPGPAGPVSAGTGRAGIPAALTPGGAQAVFRATLDVLARPGTVKRLPSAADEPLAAHVPAALLPLLALADLSTPACVVGPEATGRRADGPDRVGRDRPGGDQRPARGARRRPAGDRAAPAHRGRTGELAHRDGRRARGRGARLSRRGRDRDRGGPGHGRRGRRRRGGRGWRRRRTGRGDATGAAGGCCYGCPGPACQGRGRLSSPACPPGSPRRAVVSWRDSPPAPTCCSSRRTGP